MWTNESKEICTQQHRCNGNNDHTRTSNHSNFQQISAIPAKVVIFIKVEKNLAHLKSWSCFAHWKQEEKSIIDAAKIIQYLCQIISSCESITCHASPNRVAIFTPSNSIPGPHQTHKHLQVLLFKNTFLDIFLRTNGNMVYALLSLNQFLRKSKNSGFKEKKCEQCSRAASPKYTPVFCLFDQLASCLSNKR